MKTEQETQLSIEFLTLNLITEKQTRFKCLEGNQAFEYCTNENCPNQFIFQCQSRKCQCRLNHKSCLKADLGFTFEIINSKISDTTQIKQSIEMTFDQIIDRISQIRDKMVTEIQSKLKYQGLHKIQKLFLQSLATGQASNFTSKDTSKLWSAINGKLTSNYNIFDQLTRQLKNYEKYMLLKSQSLQNSIVKIFQKQQLIEASNGVENLKIQDSLKIYSSIVTQDEHIQSLSKLFTRKVVKGDLLLKASDYDFQIAKYFELHGDETDVMVICKTQRDKIIGGYTPLSFNPGPSQEGFVSDVSKQSFIFSLTQNDKFELKDEKKAIYRDFTKTILTFGNAEFEICDKANEVKKSCTYLTNQSYSNANYTESPESFLKLNGNDNEEFLVKEWQAWKILFQPKLE